MVSETALQSTPAPSDRCPMVDFVNLISGKWAIPVLYRLIIEDRPIRFGDLQRAARPVTQKELTRHLRAFETQGLVMRTVYAEMPPRVEYAVTNLGKTLRPTLDSLAAWMNAHGPDIRNARLPESDQQTPLGPDPDQRRA